MADNMNNVTDILSAFLPNRAYRRANAGARCTMCGLGIVAVDLALVEVESVNPLGFKSVSTRPIHTACTALLAEEVERLREVADDMEREGEAGVEGAGEAG